MEQDNADKKEDEKDKPDATPPPQSAPAAFQQFGILANQSHNPLHHI